MNVTKQLGSLPNESLTGKTNTGGGAAHNGAVGTPFSRLEAVKRDRKAAGSGLVAGGAAAGLIGRVYPASCTLISSSFVHVERVCWSRRSGIKDAHAWIDCHHRF